MPPVVAGAEEACRRIQSVHDVDRSPVSKEMIDGVLGIFAETGLFELGLMDPASGRIQPGDVRRVAEIMTALSARSGTLASIYMVVAVLGPTCIALLGTRSQREELLGRAATGALQVAFALTEPGAGSDPASLTTIAEPDGDEFVLRGEKIYTTGAATADLIIVAARPSTGSSQRDIGLFLVPAGAPGLSIEPLEKLSANLHASCHVKLEGVRVPADNTLGGREKAGGAWATLRATGSLERVVVAALATGLADAVVERSLAFARTRRQFGQSIASFQSIQHLLVEMQTERTRMRLFLENAVAASERSNDPTQEVCMAKYVCAETLQSLVAKGMRVVGGRGYFAFEDMERFYREAPFSLYAGGTVEIQKMLIARSMELA